MTDDNYQIFLTVADVLSFNKAASIHSYTQAGVSRTIANLEKELGFKLFERHSNGVELTEKGKHILPFIRNLVIQQNVLSQEAQALNDPNKGLIRVGTCTSVSFSWLPHLLPKFQEQHPKVRLQFSIGNFTQLAGWLESGEIDCTFQIESMVTEGLHFTPLLTEPLLALLPKGHPLKDLQAVSIEQLMKYPFLLQRTGAEDVRAILRKMSLEPVLTYAMDDDFAMISLVESGLGVSIFPSLHLNCLKFNGILKMLDPPQYRTMGICSRPQENLTTNTKEFLNYIESSKALFPALSQGYLAQL